jgi:vancomycin permeability regulator SanA
MRRFLVLVRPLGIALGIFIFLNLLLALREPCQSATSIWLYIRIREPLLSAIAGILGLALFVPHVALEKPGLRFIVGGVFIGFLALALGNILGFYHALFTGRIQSAAPIPFSALIAAILAGEAARAIWWAPSRSRLPLPARRFLEGLGVVAAFLALILAHILTFGSTNYAPAAGGADAAVILGAKAYPDGRLSEALEDRVVKGIELYASGQVRHLIMTGGVDGTVDEPQAMRNYAVKCGVPDSAVLLDKGGSNTYLSAKNCAAIAREHGFQKLIVVSQYYHNARVKLIFEREFAPCFTVPARYRSLRREAFFLFRETIAFLDYLLRNRTAA